MEWFFTALASVSFAAGGVVATLSVLKARSKTFVTRAELNGQIIALRQSIDDLKASGDSHFKDLKIRTGRLEAWIMERSK